MTYRSQSIADVQCGKLTRQRREAYIEIDSEQVPLCTSVHNHASLCFQRQVVVQFLNNRATALTYPACLHCSTAFTI